MRLRREGGFLLVFLLPLLWLLILLLAGSMRFARQTQGRVALQSRLDLCTVRLATERKNFLARLVPTNQTLRLTAIGIYAARGAKFAGPAGAVLGGASEAVLLRLNQSLALFQEAERAKAEIRELALLRCAPELGSKEIAICAASPPSALALRRENALFPDVKGTLTHRRETPTLANFRCRAGQGLETEIELNGTSSLQKNDFRDVYAN